MKAHDPHCRVILTVYEIERLGRDSAEPTALADHPTAQGIALGCSPDRGPAYTVGRNRAALCTPCTAISSEAVALGLVPVVQSATTV
jgi:hypothetical protein